MRDEYTKMRARCDRAFHACLMARADILRAQADEYMARASILRAQADEYMALMDHADASTAQASVRKARADQQAANRRLRECQKAFLYNARQIRRRFPQP